jgi:hypothetical protein
MAAERAQILAARRDVNAFIEYVWRVRQDQEHREWQAMWDREMFSVLHGAYGTGKTVQVKGRILHTIGANPRFQMLYVGATERHPKEQVFEIKQRIERDQRVRNVWPGLRPGGLWTTEKILVQHDGFDSNPTIRVYGAHSSSIMGARADMLVLDDITNFVNTLTADQREKLIAWLGAVLGRLSKKDCKVIVVGNPWHKHDALMDLVRNKGFAYRVTPAYRETDDGQRVATCPSALPLEVIDRFEQVLGPIEFTTRVKCEWPSAMMGRFKSRWFAQALLAGRGMDFAPTSREHEYRHLPCYTGVDLGHKKKIGSDLTAMVTAAVLPDGRRILVDVRAGRWDIEEILEQIEQVYMLFGSTIGVEDNGGQNLILEQWKKTTSLPLTDHHTGMNKHHRMHGIEGLALELSQGRWILPSPDAPASDEVGIVDPHDPYEMKRVREAEWAGEPHPEIQALIEGSLFYDPDPAKHDDDRLMAWWICRETIRNSAAYQAAMAEPERYYPLMDR